MADSRPPDGFDPAAVSDVNAQVNEADNLVHWNQLFGVPAQVLSGGHERSFIAGTSPVILPGGTNGVMVVHPVGLDVETTLIPDVSGAAFAIAVSLEPPANTGQLVGRDGANLVQIFHVTNISAVASAVKLRATIWNDAYLSPATAREKVRVTFVKNHGKALRKLGLR